QVPDPGRTATVRRPLCRLMCRSVKPAMNEDRASRYQRLKRRARIVTAVLGAACLGLFLVSGASAWLREVAVAASAGAPETLRPWIVVGLFVTALFVGAE